ncbi:MAG: hypothetical protein IKS46_03490 [Clostridia bacterium]|nr:hypothetical protein [Clostridia bacterium]
MPAAYEALVAALKATDIPFEEYGWKTRPQGIHGVITPDMEAGSMDGDGGKLDRSWETSIDVWFSRKADRRRVISTVESVLRAECGSCWDLNSSQYETTTRLFHIEWVCETAGDITPEEEDD